MAEYVDKDKFANFCLTRGFYPVLIKRALEDMPSADVVEVVRCKDCVWWEARTFGSTIGRCENPRNGLCNEYSDNTDFCSYGERIDG